jgi:hypothetical protein
MRSGGPLPGAEASFAVWRDYLFGLATQPSGTSLSQDPGQVVTNLRTRYTPNAPVNVDRTVQLVRPADPADRHSPRLSAVPRILGRPTAKVITALDRSPVRYGIDAPRSRRVAGSPVTHAG